jgi:hypothetical protein
MADPDDHQTRIARLDALIERTNTLPSWPRMAAQLERLTQEVEKLTARVATLEQECEALRQRELSRLWEEEAR